MYTPYINYKINYKYIAGVLCENKAKPKMQCNGKCHLKKELKKAATEESKSKAELKNIEQEEFLEINVFLLHNFQFIAENQLYFFHSNRYASFSLEHISPPPQA
ncbi:MAG: hypothetical protein ACKVOU_11690 [Cytophagales bacterium]